MVKLTFILPVLLAVLAAVGVKSDSDSDIIKEYCGDLLVSEPIKGERFPSTEKLTLIVRKTNFKLDQFLVGAQLYSGEPGSSDAHYLNDFWSGNQSLKSGHASASASAILGHGTHFPIDVYLRIWVHVNNGPDCVVNSDYFVITGESNTHDHH